MAGIVGFGGYVPERVITNDFWVERLDTSDEWITQRSGIKERRMAAPEESTLDLAEQAARRAVADAGLVVADIGEIILATDTPEVYTPDTSSLLQHRLGCDPVPTFDLGGSGCAGFVQALDVARARIMLHGRTILVVGVELLLRMIDWTDRSTVVLFGDGAGAVVMAPQPGRAALLDAVAGTDGSQAHILTLLTGGTKYPFGPEAVATGAYMRVDMNGRQVFREAVRRMSGAVDDLLGRIGRTPADVALVIPHQANLRIIDAVREHVSLSEEQMYVNVDRYGNTGSASVPLALSEAVAEGRIDDGDLVILTAFGAGFHWAAAALQF